mgnify:FL=1
MKHLYLRFLRISQALNAENKEFEKIDASSKLLLNEIAVMHLDGKPMTVTDAMNLSAIASPATIHRKIDELRDAGLVELIFEGKNRRTKYLVPTQAASAYFERMSKIMHKVSTAMVNAKS